MERLFLMPNRTRFQGGIKKLSDFITSEIFAKSDYRKRVIERIHPVIAEYLQEKNINIGEVVLEGKKNTPYGQKHYLDKLLADLDGRITEFDKVQFNSIAEEEMARLGEIKRDRELRVMFGVEKNMQSEPKSTELERLMELLHTGGDEGLTAVTDILKRKQGIPTLTKSDIDYITEHIEKAHRFEEGSREYAVEIGYVKARMESKLKAPASSKIKSLARIAMLGNPKTIISRNAMSNEIMAPIYNAENVIAAPLDMVISKFAGTQRTTALPSLTKQGKGFAKGAYEAVDDYRKGINTRTETGRYEIEGASAWKNKGAQRILHQADRLVGFVLDIGDRPFYEAYFNDTLNQQMRANKVSEPTPDMIKTATAVALSRTWQDTNNYTKAIKNLKKGLNLINVKGYGLGDIVIPFEATPANLMRSLVEHSPVGLAKALSADAINFVDAARKGAITSQMQREFVGKIASGVTGTLIYLASMALAKKGVLRGDDDDDKDAAAYHQYIEGKQPNSLNVGGRSITFDWAQPIGGVMASGANTVQAIAGNKNAADVIINALKTGGDALFETTVLQGIRDFFGSYSTMQGVTDALFDAPLQFIPSGLKQIADVTDDTARSTYSPDKLGSTARQIGNKIPFVSKTLEPRLNVWGEEQERIKGGNHVFNAFLNPAYVTESFQF